ncbi:MAG: 3-dehydroquinate synthase [Rhodothalassiaceae bacterium]
MTAAHDEIGRIEVALGTRGYDILIGNGVISDAGRLCSDLIAGRRLHIIADAALADTLLPELAASLAGRARAVRRLVLPAGESLKTLSAIEGAATRLTAEGIERGDLLIALGGGTIGDFTGFLAAILLRGIDFIQIPTTLLAQVDSSVGGKTGVNLETGKNLIGAFHQPRRVLIDIAALESLSLRERRAGYAEIVKYALIDDAAFFDWLESHGATLLAGDPSALRQAIATSCRAKARIVAADERERGRRALLNLGHSFGHALEAAAGYDGSLLHGEAVAIGMVMALDLSVRLGMAPARDRDRLCAHLAACGLPTRSDALGHRFEADALLRHMDKDKKVADGRIVLVLLEGIGRAVLHRDMDRARLREHLVDCLAPAS